MCEVVERDRAMASAAITGRSTWADLWRGLAAADRITGRTFCASIPDRPALALLHMPVIHLGFRWRMVLACASICATRPAQLQSVDG